MTRNKLYYFNVTGLAEPIRYLLHYCGVDFEDVRFKDFDDWTNNYKKDMPMEQCPVVDIDGDKCHQHISICRYFARKYNLYGSNAEESQKIDSLIYDVNDMRLSIANYYNEPDEKFKATLKERMLEKLPFFLNKFESKIDQDKIYFFGKKITLADIYYAGICEVTSNILERDINADHPNLKKLVDNIRNQERIKAYIDKRPTTIL